MPRTILKEVDSEAAEKWYPYMPKSVCEWEFM
jgi:hypothetical protein